MLEGDCELNHYRVCLLGLALVLAVPVLSQEESNAELKDIDAKPSFLKYNVTGDISSGLNLNRPGAEGETLRNVDLDTNRFNLGAVTFMMEHVGQTFGFHLESGFGKSFDTNVASDPWSGPNRYVGQAYVTYKPLKGMPLQLDFGKFYTSAGAEVVDPERDYQYSRSLLFVLGDPIYHFGLRASVPVTRTLTAGIQIVNGWDNVVDNNSGKTVGFTTEWRHTRWSWTNVYYVGPEKVDSNRGSRHLADSVFHFAPRSFVHGYIEGLYGYEHKLTVGHDDWYGVAGAVRFLVSKRLSLSPRTEWFSDPAGFRTGEMQHLFETTGTADYRLSRHLIARAEFRHDQSDVPYFERGEDEPLARAQNVAMIALLFNWKGGE
jgi:hypothetical protein